MLRHDAPIKDHLDLIRRSVHLVEHTALILTEHPDCTEVAQQLLTVSEIYTTAMRSLLEGVEKALERPELPRGDAGGLFDRFENAMLLAYAARVSPRDQAIRYAAVADQILIVALAELRREKPN